MINLYNAFDSEKKEIEQNQNIVLSQHNPALKIQFWQFSVLNEEQQIKAFKGGNWVLALIEYGEKWRTDLIEQVKEDDVIFLFKRGGAG